MKSIYSLLDSKVRAALKSVVSEEDLQEPEITPSTQPQFGHYQCNNALKIGKALRLSPREVAQKIAAALQDPFLFEKIEIAGPGFINMTLSSKLLSEKTEEQIRDARLGVCLPTDKQKVIVEYSSPNIAKELHVGHLRSTIIGDALARLFEFLGHDVLRLNHVGDWGTQFGMLIAYMKQNAPKVLIGEEETDLSQLMQWYRASKKCFDEDPAFKKRAQQEVVTLQSGDPLSLKAWDVICAISRKAFQEIYDLLDVHLIERGESFYNPQLPMVVKELEEKGLITLSEGAKCIFLEGFSGREGGDLPMIVQKSDGGYNYDTTDMAAIRHRLIEEKADRIIYVTDAGQSLHFSMLFKAAEKAGYFDPSKVRIDHVPFGVVLGADGKKFKTRSGDTEKLIDLLHEAIDRAFVLAKERLPELCEKELRDIASVLGIDAVKYADLSCHRIKDYVFSYDRMLRFEGNTAAFLLYAYVRVLGIKRKIGPAVEKILKEAHLQLEHPSEIALALHLSRFDLVLESIASDLLPNRLCEYLYELAEKFHAFFRDCRVEGAPEEASRLLLCEGVLRVLGQGLDLLGLKVLERM
ncbi:MAG: arginyl-tRNA synthetase [Chlamydiota bacterium]|jgi:arginyl-tRNA synthetase